MLYVKRIFIFLFALILILPLCFFNFTENCISENENRYLTPNPFGPNSKVENINDIGAQISAYVDDRIGFRSEMFDVYNFVDANFFQIMTHPYYMVGKDGYIFHRKLNNVEFSDYHKNFAEMVVEINNYCVKNDVPFIFVFNPEKLAITTDKAPVWMNYNNDWVDEFLSILEANNVPVVNNTTVLKEKYESGEAVFNKQYDAGHWNYLGAYYGCNAILSKMQEFFPEIRLNEKSDFNISAETVSELQQVGIFVEESVPVYDLKSKPKVITNKYKDSLKLDETYRHFYATENSEANSPKTLVFQGSYMNYYGYKFMSNALSEYYAVHDYANILNFEYFFEYFNPECVVFEVAEYTLLDMYFNSEKVENFSLN